MSLDLDPRQRAMLQEMGLRIWLPERLIDAIKVEAANAVDTGATAKNYPVVEAPHGDLAAPALPDFEGAGLDWPALAHAVAGCLACTLCSGRRAPVFAGGAALACADWLLVGEPPDENEERLGAPFAEQAGQLLDNMLKALGLRRQGGGGATSSAAYVTNVVKCRPALARNPEPLELATCARYLQREVALVQPKVSVAMGRFASQALLQDTVPEVAAIPLGKLRGQLYRYQGVPVIVTYHPSYLLRSQHDKARAWADLCLAQEAAQSAAPR